MAGYLHLAPLLAQHARGVDEESAAFDAHELAAVQALLADDVEQLADAAPGIAQEVERKLHLGAELVMRLDAVGRDAEDERAGLAKGGREIAEVFTLARAARRVVARVEIENELA